MSVDFGDPVFLLFLKQHYPLIYDHVSTLGSPLPNHPLADGGSRQPPIPTPHRAYTLPESHPVPPYFTNMSISSGPDQSLSSPPLVAWPLSSATSPLQFPDPLESTEMQVYEPDVLEMFLLREGTPDTSSETHSQIGGRTISPVPSQGLLLAPETVDANQIGNDGSSWERRNRKRDSKDGISCLDSDSSSNSTPPTFSRTSLTRALSIGSADLEGRPFACRICPWQFSRKRDRDRHERSVHTRESRYWCAACQQGFVRSDARQRHWKKFPQCLDQHNTLEPPVTRSRQREL